MALVSHSLAENPPTKRPNNGAAIMSSLQVKKLSQYATLPTRGSSEAAGYDLYRWVCANYILDQLPVLVLCPKVYNVYLWSQ